MDLGRIAYEAHRKSRRKWKAGEHLPKFKALTSKAQEDWWKAGEAVADAIKRRCKSVLAFRIGL